MTNVGPAPTWLHINGSRLQSVIVGNLVYRTVKVRDFTFAVQKDNHVVEFV